MIADNVIQFPAQEAAPVLCTACGLCETLNGGRQLLHGTGPLDAKIMVVGEAPGFNESREGKPFIGDSGQLLNKLLSRAGLKRENVFVTNAVRCMPTTVGKKVKKPSKKEIEACRHHLRREIEMVKPELIIALGNTPLTALTNLSGITKYHGQMQSLRAKDFPHGEGAPVPVLPTYHPAFALREPGREKDIVFDIRTGLRTLYGGFAEVDTSYTMWPFGSAGKAPNTNAPLWSFDIETNARELHDPELVIWMIAIDDGTDIWLFDTLYVRQAIDLMQRYQGALVGQNSSAFDRMIIKKLYDVNLKCHDTQLLAHLLDEEAALDLQSQAIRELGVAPWKDGFDKAFWQTWNDASDEEKIASYQYNARDTRYTRLIFEEYWKRADEATKNLYLKHSLPVSRALAEVEANGVFLSSANILESMSELEVEQQVALLHLQNLTRPDVNPASHVQVREILFSDLLLPVQGITDSGEPSTDVETLKKLQAYDVGGPILDTILRHRKSSKLLQYLRNYQERIAGSPWIHPSYSMTSTVNYRTSSYDPNLQNVPRDKRVRKAVAAPPGYVLIEADYKMLELVGMAERTGPQCALYQALMRGDDVHRIMASRLTGKLIENVTSAERSDAKPANFAFGYLADEPTYIRQALVDFDKIVSFEEAAKAKQAFRAWGIEPWWQSVREELVEFGEVKSIFGATRRLPAIYSKDKYNQLEAWRMAVNFDVASICCHIAELAMAQSIGRGVHVAGFIHDALLAYAKEDEATDVAAIMQHDMEVVVPQLIRELFNYEFTLPLRAEVTIGKYWGDK